MSEQGKQEEQEQAPAYDRSLYVTLLLEVETCYEHDHAVAYVIGEAIRTGMSNSATPESMLKLAHIKVRTHPRKGHST